MVRTDKASVSQAASVLAKASWRRNAQRKAMVHNKKKREAGKDKRRKQVKKMMKEVDKQRAGASVQALPNVQKKKDKPYGHQKKKVQKNKKNKITRFDPFTKK